MIDPAALRDWLMAEIAKRDLESDDAHVRRFAVGVVDGYLRLGRHFEVLSDEDDRAICERLSDVAGERD